jgi:RNA polymerase sigma factor (sigma-70 family)
MLRGSETDEELMILYQKGAEDAFRVLYERHSSKVFGYIKAKIRNPERANDIFQEVFVKIHKSKHLYNNSLPFLPWLFTVTKNAIVDDVRKIEKENLRIQKEENLEELPSREVAAGFSQVRPYLESLPENQKSAVYLRYVEEKTFEEISVILKTSPVNVRQLVSRGVQRMKELFQNGDKP